MPGAFFTSGACGAAGRVHFSLGGACGAVGRAHFFAAAPAAPHVAVIFRGVEAQAQKAGEAKK